ncbi:glycoside hydrolase family 76 protein [Chitinophaga horti]|uniref:Glycoside hydrolase family 76 protein n=1 Tax=Chitinophaga horti TaxID=2920382 RepID=A0ABY6J3B9_9BACT|nr:glycoside hydrolase family 76 protein [Chitinophaga horti]UYQ94161.1 glycoside hydrolase family 76 protein [Chitinophaga horti]
MRFLVLTIAAAAVLLTSCYKTREDVPVLVDRDTTSTDLTYKMKARQAMDNIYRYYSAGGTVFVRESYPTQPGDPRYAYLWPYSAMFTGATLLKQMGYTDDVAQGYYTSTLTGMEAYKDVSRTPAAYQSVPLSEGLADRFYDDNAITGIDMLEAYHLTKEQQLLDNAKLCYTFCASGESPEAGGGLYWNEGVNNNPDHRDYMKATNVTALSATLALQLYQQEKQEAYLTSAKRWYNWVKQYMLDPVDKGFWNSITIKDGSINYAKWTYNSGAMIQNAALLYKITGEQVYLDDAKVWAQGAYNIFTREVANQGRFYTANDPWFTAVLLRGYLELHAIDKNSTYIDTLVSNVDYAWQHARLPDTFQFYEDWSGSDLGRYHSLLTQVAMVEIYARISIWKAEK